ncbi:hypothetical protein U1Q18_029102 [Sarracenia purpurea var. burkii]
MSSRAVAAEQGLRSSSSRSRACRFTDDHFEPFLADRGIGVIGQTSLREILSSARLQRLMPMLGIFIPCSFLSREGLTSLICPPGSLWTNMTSPGRRGSPAISVGRTRDAMVV